MYEKYKGIDSRQIKCSDNDKNTIEAGISFDKINNQNILCFHFLDYMGNSEKIYEVTKTMYLNKENTKQLINSLKSLKFKK